MSKLDRLLTKPGPELENLKALVKIVLVAEERLRDLGVKIVDDDGYDSGCNVELENIEGGERRWLKL